MIGPVIHRLRVERLMTLTEMASATGISKSYLESIEQDIEGRPPIHVLEKICRALHVSIPCLLRKGTGMENELSSLDTSWSSLAIDAETSGVSKEQFRNFLEFELLRRRELHDR